MCGIAGTWPGSNPGVVATMLDRLAHRGPDAEGMTTSPGHGTLGHRRLSIVDLHGGDQPLRFHDQVLVANGEIYNAGQLRDEMPDRFATGSDNEAILHLLGEAGIDSVDRLRGMYAFALVLDGRLVIGRDPLGIKPVYVGRLGTDLVFSSELGALPPGTVDAAPIPPGSIWTEETGAVRYWQVPDPEPSVGELPDHAARVRAALDTSVERRLMSDVPVGAFLSGGLDSSAIVALLRAKVDELHTFSVGLPGSPDLEAAELVARSVGSTHHTYELDPDEIVEHLPAIVRALESFDQDLVRSAVPTYFTARLAAEHVKVVMTGEGADELFAGYAYHKELETDGEIHRDARRSLAELHHINLQRVDRLTMAHSLEARVPFLDLDVIDTALSVPAELRRPDAIDGQEKAVLRLAVEDLLPPEVAWRDKAQFDEGTGTAGLLPSLAPAERIDADAYRADHPGVELRTAEECWYHDLLVSSLADPEPVLANVARWSDR